MGGCGETSDCRSIDFFEDTRPAHWVVYVSMLKLLCCLRDMPLIAWFVFERAAITAWYIIINTWLVRQEHQWYSNLGYISINVQLEAVGRLPIYLPCVFVSFVNSCMYKCSANQSPTIMRNPMCAQPFELIHETPASNQMKNIHFYTRFYLAFSFFFQWRHVFLCSDLPPPSSRRFTELDKKKNRLFKLQYEFIW